MSITRVTKFPVGSALYSALETAQAFSDGKARLFCYPLSSHGAGRGAFTGFLFKHEDNYVLIDHSEISISHPSHGADFRLVLERIATETGVTFEVIDTYCRPTFTMSDQDAVAYLLSKPFTTANTLDHVEELLLAAEATPIDGSTPLFQPQPPQP